MSSNDYIKYSVVLILLVIVAFLPEPVLFGSGYFGCIHLRITGIECPLCGFTHAARALTRFQFADAIHYNFNAIILAALIVTDFASRFGSNKNLFTARNILIWTLAFGLAAIYVYRIRLFFG